MSIVLRRTMTVAAFLAWEERQELRWEFDGLKPVAMTGGTLAHETIGDNIRFALRSRLGGGPCRVQGPALKVEVAGRIRYPDAFVFCTPLPPQTTVAREPVVSSKSSAKAPPAPTGLKNCANTAPHPRSSATLSWNRT